MLFRSEKEEIRRRAAPDTTYMAAAEFGVGDDGSPLPGDASKAEEGFCG